MLLQGGSIKEKSIPSPPPPDWINPILSLSPKAESIGSVRLLSLHYNQCVLFHLTLSAPFYLGYALTKQLSKHTLLACYKPEVSKVCFVMPWGIARHLLGCHGILVTQQQDCDVTLQTPVRLGSAGRTLLCGFHAVENPFLPPWASYCFQGRIWSSNPEVVMMLLHHHHFLSVARTLWQK